MNSRQNTQHHQAVMTVLSRLYDEIRALEGARGIQVSAQDYRPRIEHFHDAVRAFSAHPNAAYEKNGRLSVERLAHDLAWLRQIEAAPIPRGTSANTRLSPSTDLVRAEDAHPLLGGDRELKGKLSELYKTYAVMFAALLADAADKNYYARTDEQNTAVEELAEVETLLKQAQKGQDVRADMEHILPNITDPELKKKLMQATASKGQRDAVSAAIAATRAAMKACDGVIAGIDKAHFHFATGQLAIYEHAKDTVKKLAGQGMNLAGQFVANAVAGAGQGMGTRGR